MANDWRGGQGGGGSGAAAANGGVGGGGGSSYVGALPGVRPVSRPGNMAGRVIVGSVGSKVRKLKEELKAEVSKLSSRSFKG